MAKVRIKRTASIANVPDEYIGHEYVSRRLAGGKRDMEVLSYAQDTGKNVLLMGPTGSGKTHVGRAFAALHRLRYYSLPCDISIDPTALFGKMVPDGEGGFHWQDGPITDMVRHGGVLNISEINFMSPKISASLFPLLDSRRQLTLLGNKGEVIDAHPGLLIIADMNPNYRGTQQLNAAFKNRFELKIVWDYDTTVEAKLVESASVRDIAKKLRARVGTDLRTPVSTNMLVELETVACDLGIDFATENFVSAFEADEQGSVRETFRLMSAELETELLALTAKRYPPDPSEEEDEAQPDASASVEEVDYEPEFELELDDEEFSDDPNAPWSTVHY